MHGAFAMDVQGYACLLKQINMDSEVWWDCSPMVYESFKKQMMVKYPDLDNAIESLLPALSADSNDGVSSATSNPTMATQVVAENPRKWIDYLNALNDGSSVQDLSRQIYDKIVTEGAKALHPRWVLSRRRHGWLSAHIEDTDNLSVPALVARGMQLARLAPNILVKVPGSDAGYQAIEQLVAKGCSINNTFCFSVSQVAACLRAIHRGRLRAQVLGVNTERAQYVISFMIGGLGAEPEFERQAVQRRIRLTAADRRWAEILVYQAMHALLRRYPISARLLLSSLAIDTDAQGQEHCWHLERTGADTTIYSLTPAIIDFLLRRLQQRRPVEPADSWAQVPKRVLNRLLTIPYFNQAYFEGDLAPADFELQPAYLSANHAAVAGQERLLAFVDGTRIHSRTAGVRALQRVQPGALS